MIQKLAPSPDILIFDAGFELRQENHATVQKLYRGRYHRRIATM